ncbi:actophorin-like [Clytia hemisphaerica]|uniref:ADF-H domain-containing protein n=2 Tax=Clytia hemisphaerica TaxID=252671 RepID=A0A7M5XMK9_9CNID
MVDSGIKITNDCIEAFKGFHKAPQKHRFCVFGFNEKFDKVVLVHSAPLDATFEDLVTILAQHKACYVFYDCQYENKEGHKRNKALYAIWSGAEASRKEKMLIASTTKEVERKCNGFAKKASFHEWSDLTEQNFIDAVCN